MEMWRKIYLVIDVLNTTFALDQRNKKCSFVPLHCLNGMAALSFFLPRLFLQCAIKNSGRYIG